MPRFSIEPKRPCTKTIGVEIFSGAGLEIESATDANPDSGFGAGSIFGQQR